MNSLRSSVFGFVLAGLSFGAAARHHTCIIDQLYSNADGGCSSSCFAKRRAWTARTCSPDKRSSPRSGSIKTFTFDHDLPGAATANRRVLIATPGFAALLIAPDYVMPARFLPTDGGTVDYAGVDQVDLRDVTNRRRELRSHRQRHDAPNAAHNFAGQIRLASRRGDRRRVLPRSARSLLHQPPAPDIDALDSGRIAGWTRTGLVFARFPRHHAGRTRCQPGLPLLHSAAARGFAFLFGIAGRVRDVAGKIGDRSELQRLRLRDRRTRSTSRCPTWRPARAPPERWRSYRVVEQARRLEPSLHDDPPCEAEMIVAATCRKATGPTAWRCARRPPDSAIRWSR